MPAPPDGTASRSGRPEPTALERELAARIAADGPIGTDALMAAALFHPQHGYYTTRSPLGAAGDFITAPEISQMFGELVGLWLAQRWMDMGSPDPFALVELGPGRGTLMCDILRAVGRVRGFLSAARLHLVEVSPLLRAVQGAALARSPGGTAVKPAWHDNLDTVPGLPVLIVANEFLDCLPVRQFVRTYDGWREKQVGLDAAGRLIFGIGAPATLPDGLAAGSAAQQPGQVAEIMPSLPVLVDALAARLARNPGSALLIDYGSDHSSPGDTLQALRRHAKVPVLDHLGEADVTAHVDFARLARLATGAGLEVAGPVGQGAFLAALGLEQRAATLARANPALHTSVTQAVDRLAGECHMGELFKVIALSAPGLAPAPGFDDRPHA
jgi:NADH dehydrogenase [ubiquinone] 1 alpha subcomplex assembly factor 7